MAVMNRSSRTLLTAGLLALACAAPAAADSVAYIKGGDVFLTTTDGARQFQVTTGGGYSTVSQADDGTLVATNAAHHLVHMDRFGTVLSEITALDGANAGSYMTFDGPFDADVSPDAARTAYGFYHSGFVQSSDGSVHADSSNATAVTRTGQATSINDAGFKYLNEWEAPEWIDGENLLVSNGPGWPSDPVAVSTAGSGDEKGWFSDPANPHPMDATLSRNKRVIAAVAGPDRQALHIYRDEDAQLLGTVYTCFNYTPDEAGMRFASPTFNADGSKLWWADGKGLEVAAIGDMSASCATGLNSVQLLPGASNPDWGPAGVPTERPAKPTPAPEPQPGAGPSPSPQPAFAVTVAKASRTGVKLRVTTPAAGRVRATARLAGRKVGSGVATAKAAGPVTVRVAFTKTGRKQLAKAHKATLKVTVAAGTASKVVRIKLAH
jgi:hypothetical protein